MSLRYPKTRTVDATEELAGVCFADPYRWLEEATAEVRDWQREQNELAASYVRDWPHFHRLKQLVERFNAPRSPGLPSYAAGRWFRTETSAATPQVLVSEAPFGAGRVVFDPGGDNHDTPLFVSWIAPSPDGTILAVGLCTDGSEQNRIQLIDVRTGEQLPDPPTQVLMDNFTGGVSWLADSKGFFFSAIDGAAVDFVQHVYFHGRDGKPTTVLADVPWLESTEYHTVTVSADGRYAVASERLMTTLPVAVARLDGSDELVWRPFVTAFDGPLVGHVLGDDYIAVATDEHSPRGRVVAIPLDSADPNDTSSWRELVPISDAVIRTLTPMGDRLVLGEFVDAYARLRIVNAKGESLGQIPLPGEGAIARGSFPIMSLLGRGHPDRYLFNFSTLTSAWATYQYGADTGELDLLRPPAAVVDNAIVEDRQAISADATSVPYHLVYRRDLDRTSAQPALIYAYGGYNVPFAPQFPGAMAAFVEAGGVYVHAHLRGGAEFGWQWWHEGRLTNKKNCYADLFSVAQHLLDTGITTRDQLAVTGGSNGGLLSGVAITQRPDLWKAVVPRVPVLDLIGGCRDAYDRMAIANELADPTDPDDVRRLASFSPYHLVQDDTPYPAVFLDAGDTDPRCPPWHARKFGARLQAATSADNPVLIRIWENAGHGWATNKHIAVMEHTEWLAFVMRQLGLPTRELIHDAPTDGD